MQDRLPRVSDAETLLHQEQYTPQELAVLLEISQYVIHEAIYSGALRATMLGHDVVSIRRRDVLDWLQARH